MSIPFHETRMGRKFFEADVPRLIEVLERLVASLDRLVDAGGDDGGATEDDGR